MLLINFIGKPYAGKLHVRFDEGVGKVFFFPSRSTLLVNISSSQSLGSGIRGCVKKKGS